MELRGIYEPVGAEGRSHRGGNPGIRPRRIGFEDLLWKAWAIASSGCYGCKKIQAAWSENHRFDRQAAHATPRARTDASPGRKDARDVALIGKAAGERNLGQREATVAQELPGARDALLDEPAMRRYTGGLTAESPSDARAS